MPEISVIVPVYNAEEYLERCIKSILNQSFTDFELILVDDGSTDSSPFLCDKAREKDNRIRVVHKDNGGVSSARNCGIDSSKGKYLIFCDSDDYVEQDWLELMYKAVTKDGADVGVCGFKFIFSDEEEKNTEIVYKGNELISVLDRSGLYTVLESQLFYIMCDKIYKAEIIKQYNLKVDETIQYSEDIHFNFNYFMKMKGGFAVIGKALYNYEKRNENSATKKYAKNLWKITLKAFAMMKKAYKSLGTDAAQYEPEMYTRFVNMICSVLHNTMKKDNPMPWFEKFKENVRIVHSAEFQQAINGSDAVGFNPIYFKVLKTRSYSLIYIFELLVKVKNKLLG